MNWISLYEEYTATHEAPSIFHTWVGISTVAAMLERKVWKRLMFDDIYPNMYVILVAPPGRCRKSSAISIGSRILSELQGVTLGVERTTPESLIQDIEMAESYFDIGPRVYGHCSLTCISKELDTLMSVKPEDMLKLLTDLYDSQVHDIWTYKTKGSGMNRITGVWLNLLGGTVPDFFQGPLIQRSIGLGFTSRCIFVFADRRRHRSLDCDDRLVRKLQKGMEEIHKLRGEFFFDAPGEVFFRDWYLNLPNEAETIEALSPYYERKHVHVIKLSMILSACEGGNNMTIGKQHIQSALRILEKTEAKMTRVFGGTGRAPTAPDSDRILQQIAMARGGISEASLIERNYKQIDLPPLRMLLETFVSMNMVRLDIKNGQKWYTYIGRDSDGHKC